MADLSLVFDILARDRASSELNAVGDTAERTGQRVLGGLKVIAGGLVGLGIVAGFRELYDAAAESERIGRLTESTIRATGGAARISADEVGDLAGAISAKTGIDDEAIQSGQNLLLTFKNIRNETGAGNDIFNQATQTLADMSTVLGTDASGSAIQLGKALNDPIKGITTLSRAGVQFTEDQKEQIRTLVESGDTLGAQKIILGELTAQFGGAAEAAGTPLEKMNVAIGNVAESLGSRLVPIVDTFSTVGIEAIEGVSAGFSDGETSAEGFEGAMQDVGVALRDVADFGGEVVGIGRDVVGFLDSVPGPVVAGVAAMAGFALLKGPVGSALETIALKALYARDGVVAATTSMSGARVAGAGFIGLLGGPWGLALGAATVGLGFLAAGLGDSTDVAEDAETAQRSFADAVREANGAIDESVRAAAAKAAQDVGLLDIADDLGLSLPTVTDAVLGNRDAYDELVGAANRYYDQSLSYENAGDLGMTENAAQVDDFIAGLDVLAPTVERTRQEQEALGAATEQTGTALGEATPTAEMFASEMEGVAQTVSDAKKEVDNYKLSLDILTGANVSLIQVQGAYFDSLEFSYESLAGLEGAVADVNGQLNLQSEAGRFASDVLLGVRDSGNQLISTLVQQGESADTVRGQDAQLRDSFIATAQEMNFSSDQAINLANQILGIPEERQVQIDADVAAASGGVSGFQAQVAGLVDGFVDIFANTDPADQALDNFIAVRRGVNIVAGVFGLPGRADGGPIRGPGTGRSDSILGIDAFTGVPTSFVSDGEFVTNERRYGENRSLVEAINAGLVPPGIDPADLQYLAGGGPVLGQKTLPVSLDLSLAASQLDAAVGTAGTGAVGSGWQSIWEFVKARIPQARINSTYRPGDPGYHGRGKAIDFGFGSGPGGAGSAGLASINRLLHDGLGANLAELIYDGRGDDRPDLKNGRPHRYSASTQADHDNHVHAAAYDNGGLLQPGYTLAFNGTGKPEPIRTAEQEAALMGARRSVEINIQVDRDADRIARATSRALADNDWLAGIGA